MCTDRWEGRVNGAPRTVFARSQWVRLGPAEPPPVDAAELDRLRGRNEPVGLNEVDEVYRPLSQLVRVQRSAGLDLAAATADFLGRPAERRPFVLGLAGSVAAGKSTTARILQALLGTGSVVVDIVTTDGFLLPNLTLEQRRLLPRKGFPESYDRKALIRFLLALRSGAEEVPAPVYDHVAYDVRKGGRQVLRRPDIVIVEGLNLLQPPVARRDGGLFVSDLLDFTVYVDAAETDLRRWYVERFLELRRTAFADPRSYFRRYAGLSDGSAVATAEHIWDTINAVNLRENIAPTHDRADLIVRKGADHAVESVSLRLR
ncbi:MAG: type I pantothenate kinase [Mycobacteriales bacterium]